MVVIWCKFCHLTKKERKASTLVELSVCQECSGKILEEVLASGLSIPELHDSLQRIVTEKPK